MDVSALLQGDNSEEAFAELVRQHATSGVSGVVPKFLDSDAEKIRFGPHKKTSLFTHRHIIKGSSRLLPFVSLNEHLCMQVTKRVMPAALTEVSADGQALIVHRFDVDENGARFWGMEDFMTIKETPVTNAVNLSLFMVNLSPRQLAAFRRSHPDAGVLDLKAFFRGRRYVHATIELLPEPPNPNIIAPILHYVASMGAIHSTQALITQP